MNLTTTLTVGLVVLLAVGGVAAAGTGVGTPVLSGAATQPTETTTTNIDARATLDNGTVTVTVVDAGEPVRNVTVVSDDETVGVTDENGTVTFQTTADEDLELELVGSDFEAELTYVIQDGALTLQEETYEYDRDDEEQDDEEQDDEDEDEDKDEEAEAEAGAEADDEADEDAEADEEDSDDGEAEDGDAEEEADEDEQADDDSDDD